MSRFKRGIVVTFALLVVTSVYAQKAGAQKAVPVTSAVLGPSDPAAPVILSDAAVSGLLTYVTDRRTGTTSQLDADGEWRLEGGSRRFWLDLGANTLFAGQHVGASIFTYCGSNGLRTITSLGARESTTCPMLFRVGSPSDPFFYRLAFNTFKRPGTGDATFTCEAVGTSGCVQWRVRPGDNDYLPGDGRSTARLLKVTPAQKRSPEQEEFIGDYDVIFEFTITRP